MILVMNQIRLSVILIHYGDNAVSLQACISLDGSSADIEYRDIPKTGTSYTFNLTENERNVLRNSCTNATSRAITFIVKTIIGSTTYTNAKTVKLNIVNANPILDISSISYADTNSTTVNITKNDQNIVQGLSNLVVTLDAATAKKGASITKYEATLNGVTKTRTTPGTIDFGKVDSSSDLSLIVTVTDTRGNTLSVTKTVKFLAWTIPSGNISLSRLNNFEDTTFLKVKATYSSVDSKNVLTIKYQYKKTTDTDYSEEYTASDDVQSEIICDKNHAWDFRIKVSDSFGSTTYNAVLAKGKFIVFYDVNKLSVGINGFPTHDNSLEIFGDVYINGIKLNSDT